MKILITAAGSPGFLSFCKSLKQNNLGLDIEIHSCDANPESIGFNFSSSYFVAPFGDDAEYIPKVYEYCFMNDISVIIPCSDTELIPLSQNIKTFEEIGCKILTSEERSLIRVLDKSNLLEECLKDDSLKSLCPEYFECKNYLEFKKAYKNISSTGKKVCIKPSKSYGSRGFRVIEELETPYELFGKKASFNKITYKNLKEILKKGDFPPILVMEYLEGEEFSVDCLKFFSDFYCVSRRRDSVTNGICSTGEAVYRKELIDFSEILCDKFKLAYNVNIQFKYDSCGNPKILEINPRVAGTMELSRGAGINFIEIALCKALSIIPQKDNYKVKWGIKMKRVWEEVFSLEDKAFIMNNTKGMLENNGIF